MAAVPSDLPVEQPHTQRSVTFFGHLSTAAAAASPYIFPSSPSQQSGGRSVSGLFVKPRSQLSQSSKSSDQQSERAQSGEIQDSAANLDASGGPPRSVNEGYESYSLWGSSSNEVVRWFTKWTTQTSHSETGSRGRWLSRRKRKELDARAFKELTTFDGCPELLRGTPLHVIMRSQASILRDSQGTDETWNLSKVVSGRLCAFISHNWTVHRQKKYFCLALHFNFRSAAVVAGLYLVVVSVLHSSGKLPLIDMGSEPTGFLGRALAIPMFLLILVFARDLFPWLFLQPYVFLDKTCINQADATLQRQGIMKLGAFLHHSDEMLICYSDVYLCKLWTVFELGCFHCVGRSRRITVIPTSVPCTLIVGLCVAYPCELAVLFLRENLDIVLAVPYLVWYCFLFAMAAYFREVEMGKERMWATLATFSIHKSHCALESDRAIVYSCIASLLRSTGRVDELATEEEALEAFDEIVRTEIPSAFGDCLLRMGIHTRHLMGCVLLAVLPRAADGAAAIHFDLTWKQWVTRHLLVDLTHGGCAVPIAMLALWAVASRLTRVEGVRKYVGLFISTIFPSLLARFSRVRLEAFGESCDGSRCLGIFAMGYILLQLVICFVLAHPLLSRCTKKKAPSSTHSTDIKASSLSASCDV